MVMLRYCLGRCFGVGLLLAIAASQAACATEGLLFWSHASGIGRSLADGSLPTRELANGFQVGGIIGSFPRDQLIWSDLLPTVPIVPSGLLRTAPLDGIPVGSLVERLPHPGPLALDDARDQVYWADLETNEILRSRLDGSAIDVVLPASLEVAELGGLTLDPAQNGLYFSYVNPLIDSLYPGAIGRIDLETSERINVVNGLSHPQGLALHRDLLFWADDLLGTGGVIGRADLRSGERDLVVTDLEAPVGVAVDPLTERLYWTDRLAGNIQRASFQGTERSVVLEGLDQPRALTFVIVPEPCGLIAAPAFLLVGSALRRSRRGRRGRDLPSVG